MEKLVCKICGKEFMYNKLSSCRAQLKMHLAIEHNMTTEEYLVKTEYGGKQPMCPCGCGKPLHVNKGDSWRFNTYAEDTCFGNMLKKSNDNIKKKLKPTLSKKFDIVKYYKSHYDYDSYKSAWDVFSSKESNLSETANKAGLDKRTLKKVWLTLNICTEEELLALLEYYQYNYAHDKTKYDILLENDSGYVWMYKVLKNNPGYYSINSLVKYYNECHIEKMDFTPNCVYKKIKELYGNEIDAYLRYGMHSNEEYSLFFVLQFYFPHKKIRLGKKIEKDKRHYIFDISIDDKLLIEYDSTGKYHTDKNRDDNKEIIAKELGYKFIRLTKKDIADPDLIKEINKLLEDEI